MRLSLARATNRAQLGVRNVFWLSSPGFEQRPRRRRLTKRHRGFVGSNNFVNVGEPLVVSLPNHSLFVLFVGIRAAFGRELKPCRWPVIAVFVNEVIFEYFSSRNQIVLDRNFSVRKSRLQRLGEECSTRRQRLSRSAEEAQGGYSDSPPGLPGQYWCSSRGEMAARLISMKPTP